MKLTSQQRNHISAAFPELKDWIEQRETNNLLEEVKAKSASSNDMMSTFLMSQLIGKLETVKGEKGETGDDGYTPIKGKDYLTDGELDSIISYILKEATPIKGKDYDDGETGPTGFTGPRGSDGLNGRDGSPDSPEQIIDKINTLENVLNISVIKGVVSKKDLEDRSKTIEAGMQKIEGRVKLLDLRWHGSGISSVTHDSTLTGSGTPSSPLSVVTSAASTGFQRPLTGAIDGVNKVFTWLTAPNALISDGGGIQKNNNGTSPVDTTANWTGTTTTTLLVAPTSSLFAVA